MGKANISVGDDTPTGEPSDAPEGPYITDDDDGSRTRRKQGDDAGANAPRPKNDDPTKGRPSGAIRPDF